MSRESYDLEELITQIIRGANERAILCRRKNKDYVANKDFSVTDAFDRVASMERRTGCQVALTFIATKLSRLIALNSCNKKAVNESIKDNIQDLHQYLEFYQFMKDREKSDG